MVAAVWARWRARLLDIERGDQPRLHAEAADFEIVVLDAERIARDGEARLGLAGEDVVARRLATRSRSAPWRDRSRCRHSWRASASMLRLIAAEQVNLIERIGARARNCRAGRPRRAGRGHSWPIRIRSAAAASAGLHQALARLAQPRHGLGDIQIAAARALDDRGQQRIVETGPPRRDIGRLRRRRGGRIASGTPSAPVAGGA